MPSSFSIFLFFFCTASFVGFGIYSPFYFYQKWRNPTKYLKRWDADAFTILLTAGMIYFALWISELILYYLELKEEMRPEFVNALTGPNGFWLWLPPAFYLALSQLFWINKLREMVVARLLISLLLIIGFTRMMSVAGKIIPEFSFGWHLKPEYNASGYTVLDCILKTLIFVTLTGTVYLLRTRQK